MTTAVEEAKRRADVSSDIFADRLRGFVSRWKPEDPYAVCDFQMDLTRLMVDAMRNKSECLSFGIASYADQRFSEIAMRPLVVIREEPKR